MEALLLLLGFGALFVGLLAYATFSWGCVTYLFWCWFLMPVFPSLPHITIVQAIGLGFFISLFKPVDITKKEEEDGKKKTGRAIAALFIPWVTLLLGYLFKHWFM